MVLTALDGRSLLAGAIVFTLIFTVSLFLGDALLYALLLAGIWPIYFWGSHKGYRVEILPSQAVILHRTFRFLVKTGEQEIPFSSVADIVVTPGQDQRKNPAHFLTIITVDGAQIPLDLGHRSRDASAPLVSELRDLVIPEARRQQRPSDGEPLVAREEFNGLNDDLLQATTPSTAKSFIEQWRERPVSLPRRLFRLIKRPTQLIASPRTAKDAWAALPADRRQVMQETGFRFLTEVQGGLRLRPLRSLFFVDPSETLLVEHQVDTALCSLTTFFDSPLVLTTWLSSGESLLAQSDTFSHRAGSGQPGPDLLDHATRRNALAAQDTTPVRCQSAADALNLTRFFSDQIFPDRSALKALGQLAFILACVVFFIIVLWFGDIALA